MSRSPSPGPWLRDALQGLAVDEPDIAELLVVSLLSAQAGLVKDSLTYELAVQGGTTHRVVVDPDRVRVELPGPGPEAVRVAGPLAALVPLVAGGAGRRLPGTRIDGRRHLRRLIKARRAPLGLAELAAADIAPSPGLLLTVLARAVEPRWTARRHPLTVDVASEGSDRWRVVASGDGPLAIVPADERRGRVTVRRPAHLRAPPRRRPRGDRRARRRLRRGRPPRRPHAALLARPRPAPPALIAASQHRIPHLAGSLRDPPSQPTPPSDPPPILDLCP